MSIRARLIAITDAIDRATSITTIVILVFIVCANAVERATTRVAISTEKR